MLRQILRCLCPYGFFTTRGLWLTHSVRSVTRRQNDFLTLLRISTWSTFNVTWFPPHLKNVHKANLLESLQTWRRRPARHSSFRSLNQTGGPENQTIMFHCSASLAHLNFLAKVTFRCAGSAYLAVALLLFQRLLQFALCTYGPSTVSQP